MGFAEGVAGETCNEPPNLLNLVLGPSKRHCRCVEFLLNLSDNGPLLLVQCPAQNICSARRQTCECLTDLQDVFLINNEPERVFQHRLKRWVRVGDWLQALITARKGQFLAFVSSTWADGTHDCDEGINVSYVALTAQARHCWAVDVMNSPCPTRDQVPDLRILPWLKRIQFNADVPGCQGSFGITHNSQTALSQNIHLHQADHLHCIHVEMCRCIAFVGNEGCGQVMHRFT